MSATISLLFGLLVAIVILATLASRLRLPYAILLVIGGLAARLCPRSSQRLHSILSSFWCSFCHR